MVSISPNNCESEITIHGQTYHIVTLLGHGKGGYSYLAKLGDKEVVIKKIHHEPCSYYTFGNKIEAELRDYELLLNAHIRIPEMLDVDKEQEIIVKAYIEGDTIFDMVKNDTPVEPYIEQVRDMAECAKKAGLNIDYFPTNFIVHNCVLYYIDYECNSYMEQWSFENWGIAYWSKTPQFLAYLKTHQ